MHIIKGVEKEECYTSFYPFGVFAENELRELSFSEITILYGNNGSGKSTALNLMAEKMKAEREKWASLLQKRRHDCL